MHLIDRLLEVTLPDEPERFGAVLWEAYFDESGDDGGFPIMTVGGYLVRPNSARELESKWRKILRKHNLPFFHMVECAHGTDHFKDKSREERVNIQKEVFAVINQYVEISLAASVSLRDFVPAKKVKDPYSYCVLLCYTLLTNLLRDKDPSFKLSMYYEQGHKHSTNALKLFNEIEIPNTSFSFIGKSDSGMIQAADIMAWQYTKYVKDKAKMETRGTRKDFKFLMEKPGIFINGECPSKGVLIHQMYSGGEDDKDNLDLLVDIFGDYPERLTEPMVALDKLS